MGLVERGRGKEERKEGDLGKRRWWTVVVVGRMRRERDTRWVRYNGFAIPSGNRDRISRSS